MNEMACLASKDGSLLHASVLNRNALNGNALKVLSLHSTGLLGGHGDRFSSSEHALKSLVRDFRDGQMLKECSSLAPVRVL
jgi:hypothetical protein